MKAPFFRLFVLLLLLVFAIGFGLLPLQAQCPGGACEAAIFDAAPSPPADASPYPNPYQTADWDSAWEGEIYSVASYHFSAAPTTSHQPPSASYARPSVRKACRNGWFAARQRDGWVPLQPLRNLRKLQLASLTNRANRDNPLAAARLQGVYARRK